MLTSASLPAADETVTADIGRSGSGGGDVGDIRCCSDDDDDEKEEEEEEH